MHAAQRAQARFGRLLNRCCSPTHPGCPTLPVCGSTVSFRSDSNHCANSRHSAIAANRGQMDFSELPRFRNRKRGRLPLFAAKNGFHARCCWKRVRPCFPFFPQAKQPEQGKRSSQQKCLPRAQGHRFFCPPAPNSGEHSPHGSPKRCITMPFHCRWTAKATLFTAGSKRRWCCSACFDEQPEQAEAFFQSHSGHRLWRWRGLCSQSSKLSSPRTFTPQRSNSAAANCVLSIPSGRSSSNPGGRTSPFAANVSPHKIVRGSPVSSSPSNSRGTRFAESETKAPCSGSGAVKPDTHSDSPNASINKRRSLRLYPQGRRKRRNSVDPVGQNSSRVDNGDRRSPFLRPPCAQNANCRVEQQNQRQRPGHKRAHTAFFFRQCAFRQQHVRAQASRRPADLIPRKLAVRGLYCHSVKRYRTGQSELFGQNSRCGFPAAPPFLRRSDLQRNKQSLFPFLFSFCPLFPSIHMYIHHKKDGAEPLKIHENRVDFCHGTCYDIENRILQLKIEARERISNAGQEDVRSIRPARKGKPPKEIRRTVSWAHGTRGVRLSLFAECYYNCGTHGAQQWLTIIMADASVIFCIIRKESIT